VVLHADLNAAKNILHRYQSLTGCCQPAYCSPNGSNKPPALAGGS
jgi:transposase